MYLQSYVFPVALYSVQDGEANVKEVMGTSFLIGKRGVFLTARHVMESAQANAKAKDLQYGLVVKGDDGNSPKSFIARPLFIEFAEAPYDIAVGQITYGFASTLTLQSVDVELWKEVATFGYPLNAVSGSPTDLRLNIRGHRGYVQRVLSPGDIPVGTSPAAFELSFLLGRGISGAPLFIHSNPQDIVVGVCVGSIRSELVEDERLEVMDNNSTYLELKLKIEEYGVAHDLRPLHDWRPVGLHGKSLLEESQSDAS